MKKFFLAVIALCLTTGAFAQGFQWGVKGGLNITGITNFDDGKMKPSIYVGAFAEWIINDYIGIQPEVLYSRQGNKFDLNGHDYWTRLNYLNIPVLAKVYVLENLSVDVGPQFGILLNARLKYKVDGDNHTEEIDNAKNFDISIPIGLTYNFRRKWDFSARYNIGVTKVFSDNGDTPKNSVIQLGVGYRF